MNLLCSSAGGSQGGGDPPLAPLLDSEEHLCARETAPSTPVVDTSDAGPELGGGLLVTETATRELRIERLPPGLLTTTGHDVVQIAENSTQSQQALAEEAFRNVKSDEPTLACVPSKKAPSPVADYIRVLVARWLKENPTLPKSELARRGGFSPSLLNQLELGQGVREESYPRWAQALGISVSELVRQAWVWAPEQERLENIVAAEELPEASGLKEAIEAAKSLLHATDAEIRTALAAFRIEELKDRDGAYWLQLLMAELGARRAETRIEEQARFARAAEHKNDRKAEAAKAEAAARHETAKRRTRRKPA